MQKEKQQKTQQEKIQKILLYMKKTRFLCNTKNCFASVSSKSTTHCTFCFFENKKKNGLIYCRQSHVLYSIIIH